jgi:hypothetical protein
LAASSPWITLALRPDVEMPSAISPGRPNASTWRAKMRSKPRSLAPAVKAELSVVSAKAAIGARSWR